MHYFKNEFFSLPKELENKNIINHTKELNAPSILILMNENGIEAVEKSPPKMLLGVISTAEVLQKLKVTCPKFACTNPRKAWAFLCSKNFPKTVKHKIAITGTNGKTSIASFICQILNKFGVPNLMSGTLGLFENGKPLMKSMNTTADAALIHQTLDAFANKYGQDAFFVFEATSIGIDQERISYINPELGIINNFSQDHLDYHKTIEEYLKSKLRLAEMCKKFIAHKSIEYEGLKYGDELINVKQGEKLEVTYRFDNIEYNKKFNLFGEFQAENILSAIIALKEFFPLDKIMENIECLEAILGRMQKIGPIVIDFSHTPDALKKAIQCINEVKGNKKLVTIMGCGGNRDATKRPIIGNILNQSDKIIITNDNPRNEDPAEIAKQILEGVDRQSDVEILLDRKEAIKKGYQLAKNENYICLLAGRGAEEFQEFENGRRVPFSDIEFVKTLIK